MPTLQANSILSAQPAAAPTGYRWNEAVLQRVLSDYGLSDAGALLRAAADFDQGNRYLDEAELTAAAELLRDVDVQGYRLDPSTLRKVVRQHHLHSAAALVRRAVAFDDGDHFLSKQELQLAAKSFSDPVAWSSPATTQLYSRPKTLRGWSWSPAVLDDVMKTYGVGDAKALLRAAMLHDNGNRYLDRQELAAAAWDLIRQGSGAAYSAGTVLDVMQQRHISSASALLATAVGLDDGDAVLTRAELEAAASELQKIVPAHDVAEVQRRIEALRGRDDLEVTELGVAHGEPIRAVHFPCLGKEPAVRLLLTAGVHGNEPAGTGAAMKLIEELAAQPELRQRIEVTVVPLLNPSGMAAGCRRTRDEIDLNRVFTDDANAPAEVQALRRLLVERSFNLALDLHGAKAKRGGFFALHNGAEALMQNAMLSFATSWPVLDGDSKPYALSAPGVAASDNDGTLKNLAKAHGTPHTATIESPASLSYLDQVIGHVEIVHHAMAAALTDG